MKKLNLWNRGVKLQVEVIEIGFVMMGGVRVVLAIIGVLRFLFITVIFFCSSFDWVGGM